MYLQKILNVFTKKKIKLKKNIYLIIIILIIIISIFIFLHYKNNYENMDNGKDNDNFFDLKTLREDEKNKNNEKNIVLNLKDYTIENPKENLPNPYITGTTTVDKDSLNKRSILTNNLYNLCHNINNYVDLLIYTNDDNYIKDLKDLLLKLANNNAYVFDNSYSGDMLGWSVELNFNYIPTICKAYLLIENKFDNNEKNIIKKNLNKIYTQTNVLAKKENNLKYLYGRSGYLMSVVDNNAIFFKDSQKILLYALNQINNDGVILSEMKREHKSYLYNLISINIICEMYYIRNKILKGNYINKLKDIKDFDKINKEINSLSSRMEKMVNLALSTYIENTKSKNIDEEGNYLNPKNPYIKEIIKNKKINRDNIGQIIRPNFIFLKFDFVIKYLTNTNKIFIKENLNDYTKTSPLRFVNGR